MKKGKKGYGSSGRKKGAKGGGLGCVKGHKPSAGSK